MRPLAHNLKDKVRKALAEQEAAGIIRKSFSEWSSALRVVHKQDGSIRITVDYTPLNTIKYQLNFGQFNLQHLYVSSAYTNTSQCLWELKQHRPGSNASWKPPLQTLFRQKRWKYT